MDPDSMVDAANATMTFGAKIAGLIQDFARPVNEKRLARARVKSLEGFAYFHARHPELEFSCDNDGLQITAGAMDKTSESDEPQNAVTAFATALSSREESARAENAVSVIQEAATEIPFDEEVSSDPVDESWFLHFLDQAGYVSDEQVKAIWARLLAEEVARPGSCSIRTMETLGQLSTHEALLFEKATQYVVESSSTYFISNETTGGLLSYEETATLQDAGLLAPSDGAALSMKSDKDGEISFFMGGYLLIVKTRLHSQLQQSVMLLSAAGRQLYQLLGVQSNLDAARAYAQVIAFKPNIEAIGIHKIINVGDDDTCSYEPAPIDTVKL